MIKSKAGFTLIEILVVTIIIGILAATALLYYGRFIERMRMTEALQLFGTTLAAQERNMLKKYRYTDLWEYLDVIPHQLSTGGVNPKYYDADHKIYFTNGSGPDGDSGIGSFRPGYQVYFMKPGEGENASNHWIIKADRIGGGTYSEGYSLLRAFDDTKIYCIPNAEKNHEDSITLCMDFMGVSTKEELDAIGNPLTSAGELDPHDNIASAGKSGAGNDAEEGENGANENPEGTNSDVDGEGNNNSAPKTLDVEGGTDNENTEAGTHEPAQDNNGGNTPAGDTPAGEDASANEQPAGGEQSGNGDAGSTTPSSGNSDNPGTTPSSGTQGGSEDTGSDNPAANQGSATQGSGTDNPASGNNNGNNGNQNAGPGNNSGDDNSGNPNAGPGNNSGSGNNSSGGGSSNSDWKETLCRWTLGIICL